MKIRPKNCRYYDLIHVPHGHIPAPKANLWSSLPLPVKQERGLMYHCPVCGEPSFFKIRYMCQGCRMEYEWGDDWIDEYAYKKYRKKQRREYFRNIWKRLEYLFLPVLVLLGKAWYIRSERLHHSDPEYQIQTRQIEEWLQNLPEDYDPWNDEELIQK